MVNRRAEELHWSSHFALNGTALNGHGANDQFRESLVHLDDEELPALISFAEIHHILIRRFDSVASSGAGFEQQMAAGRAQNAETVVPQFHPLVLEAEHPAATPLFGFCR
jgi:hypothetical protein